jgi:diguanylate cyclase (GGDEF)-like protein/PAS domain S-box-containing protein
MTIRVRIFTAAALAVAATVIAALLLAVGASRSLAADAEQEKTRATMRSVAALLTLAQEFALHGEERAAEQWRRAHARLMRQLAEHVQSGAASPARRALREAAGELPALFERLAEVAAQPEAGFNARRRELLVDQLLARTQGLADEAYRWSREAAADEQAARRQLRIGGALALLLLLATTLAQPLVVWRRVLRPLAALEKAALAIESGDYSTRCASRSGNELGALSRRFDAMSEALAERSRQLELTNASLDLEAEARRISEERLQAITDNVPALITHVDAQRRYTFVNAYLRNGAGLDPADFLGRTMREACGARLYAEFEPHVDAALAGTPAAFETTLAIGGAKRHFQTDYIPERSEDGAVRGFYAISFDITARKLGEQLVLRSRQRLRTITDNLPVLVAYIDRQHVYRFVNATYTEWFGRPVSEVEGRGVAEVVGAATYAQRRPWIERALGGERVEFEQVTELPGGERHLHGVYIPHREDGQVVGLYAMVSDVSAVKATEAKLERLAGFDSLTGLPNRHQFNERLAEAMTRSRRGRVAMGLMFLDVDHFKSINDTLGHAAGDAVLKAFAQRLAQAVRTTDTVARLGGDEFVVILGELCAAEEAAQVARKLVAAVRGDFLVEGRRLAVTTSIGIALFDGIEEASASELMARADAALYRTKSEGRNGYRMAQPLAA